MTDGITHYTKQLYFLFIRYLSNGCVDAATAIRVENEISSKIQILPEAVLFILY